MKFSVLISIYHKEKADYFNRCMYSIWDEQTLKPNEIVLVEDGELNPKLYDAINKWKERLGEIFKVVPINKNVGLGEALNRGLKECSYSIIARMDTDDISMPDRFEKELELFKKSNIDICGSWVSEFDNDENSIISYRQVPKTDSEIKKFAKKRNPLNHPSVVYKKDSVIKAGGYKTMIGFEDYYLWVRMILNNANFYNIQEPLVKMRAGYKQLERRRGIKYIKAEIIFLNRIREEGFLNNYEFLKNLTLRLIVRIMPRDILRLIYRLIRR